MRHLFIIVFVLMAIMGFAQRTPQPTANPQVNNFNYNRFNGYVGIEYGLMLRIRDTNWTPTNNFMAFIINTSDSLPYWWNGAKWQKIASPATGFVKYSDSTVIFVTPKQQKDSLANYVNLYGNQITGLGATKEWQADQTFDASMIQNFKGGSIDRHQVLDSVSNITSASTNIFVNSFRNINYNYHSGGALPGAVGVTNNLLLDDIADSLGSLLSSQGAFNAQIAFRSKNGSVASTYSVTNFNKNGSLIAASIGATLLTDSGDIAANKTWNIDVPMVGVLSHIDLPKHGTAYSYTDFDAGLTSLLDSAGNNYTLTTRYGLRIRNLTNSHTTNTYAIKQEGATDSIILSTQNIKTPNLTTGTAAFTIQTDANGYWIKKTYLPTVSAVLDFPSTTSTTVSDLTVTVTGAALGDPVTVGVPNAAITATATYSYWVSSANTVTIRYSPKATENPASGTFNVLVTKQ